MEYKKFEAINGVGALGVTYHSCPYWRRSDGRPYLHVSLWWVKILILLPFKDVTPKGHGTATSDYGIFWWPSVRLKPHLHWNKLK